MIANTFLVAKSYFSEQTAPFAIRCTYDIIRSATDAEQWEEKFDFLISNRQCPKDLKGEMKDEKNACRSDAEPDRERILVEFRDVGGGPGWLTFIGPLFQRRQNQFYQYDRPTLYLWAQEHSTNVMDMAPMKKNDEYPITWKIYRRENRKDGIMYGPYNTCDHLVESIFTIPPVALEMEIKATAEVVQRIRNRTWKPEYPTYMDALNLVAGLWNEMFGERVWEK